MHEKTKLTVTALLILWIFVFGFLLPKGSFSRVTPPPKPTPPTKPASPQKPVFGESFSTQTTTPNREGFYFYQGTSMATAHVSGVAALLLSQGASGPDQIKNQLEAKALDLGPSGWDREYGFGLIDAAAALGVPIRPSSTPTPTPTPTTFSWRDYICQRYPWWSGCG